jgi:hypothetical protein
MSAIDLPEEKLDQPAADSEEEDASLTSDCPFPLLEGTDTQSSSL